MASWARTQSVVTLSSCEAELLSLNTGAAEEKWLQNLLAEMGIQTQLVLETDSSAAQAVTHMLGVGRMRHVAIRTVWLQDEVRAKRLEIRKVAGAVNDADMMTKALQPKRLMDLAMRVGLRPSFEEVSVIAMMGGGPLRRC